MSVVKSFAVGNGDMFYIQHNSDNFTIIDCSLAADNYERIARELRNASQGKGITRFISTHPDEDHIRGLSYLFSEMSIRNFYCVQNYATKEDVSPDFEKYCELRNSDRAFHIYRGCSRKWMNVEGDGRGSSGLSILWPDTTNQYYQEALQAACDGYSPNNISAVVSYRLQDGPSFMWMGDLDSSFMVDVEKELDLSHVDILFAPHHGRDSGRVPDSLLEKLTPNLVVIGEAPSEHLCYYSGCDTLTQNRAGDITFHCEGPWAHVYVSNPTYESSCLVQARPFPDPQYGHSAGSVYVAPASESGQSSGPVSQV